jgi:hypothetical protein
VYLDIQGTLPLEQGARRLWAWTVDYPKIYLRDISIRTRIKTTLGLDNRLSQNLFDRHFH